MSKRKVIETFNDGWASEVQDDGQIALVQRDQEEGARLVPLASIQGNPYQPRAAEDTAAVAEIALSIYRQGLMQFPVARKINGHFELAFGHTRRAAYELLASAGLPEQDVAPDERFATMPLQVADLDDRQMFELALAENLKRRDLNAIERARSMKVYMDQFQASSREAAELFGVNDATVRGTIRLLNLPEEVQHKIAAGEISQGAARSLLSLQTISPKSVEVAAEDIAGGAEPDKAIEDVLRVNPDVTRMWNKWQRNQEPRAGDGLWLLNQELPEDKFPWLPTKAILKAITAGELPKTRVEYYNDQLNMSFDPATVARLIEESPDDAESIGRIAHLQRPPACSACPVHMVLDGAHLCGFKACHTRKAGAFAQMELERLSKEMGIAIHDPDKDVQPYARISRNRWDDGYGEAKKLVEVKSPLLRLKIGSNAGSDMWTGSQFAEIIAVGALAQAMLDRAAKSQNRRESQDYMQARWKRDQARREASSKFYEEQKLAACFAPAFKGLDNIAALCMLIDCPMPKNGKGRADTLAGLRIKLASHALRYGVGQKKEAGPVALAKYLQKIATTWGVELPADVLATAKRYEPVSTETAKKKSSKPAAAAEPVEEDGDEVEDNN